MPLDADWALHPALRDTVLPLFAKNEAAFVPFAGTDDTSRSHFETQDSIELGQALQGRRDFQSGFLNRLAGVLGGRDAIAFTDRLPLIFRGSAQVPNLALASMNRPGIDARQAELITAMYQGSRYAGSVSEGFAVRSQATQALAGEMVEANRNAITAKGFEGEARRIGRLMKERYALGFIDVGGWDTHVGQGNGSGYLANRLGELSKGLAAFAEESGEAWRNTVVIVVSEFGRTFKENGNRGTDHGHGSVFWALGGAVRGGRVAGRAGQPWRRARCSRTATTRCSTSTGRCSAACSPSCMASHRRSFSRCSQAARRKTSASFEGLPSTPNIRFEFPGPAHQSLAGPTDS